jgi:hypothetical protein
MAEYIYVMKVQLYRGFSSTLQACEEAGRFDVQRCGRRDDAG